MHNSHNTNICYSASSHGLALKGEGTESLLSLLCGLSMEGLIKQPPIIKAGDNTAA